MPSSMKPMTNAAEPASKPEMRYHPTASVAMNPAMTAPTTALRIPTKIDDPQDLRESWQDRWVWRYVDRVVVGRSA